MLKQFLVSLLDAVFPPLCHLCKTFIPNAGEVHICDTCRENMPLAAPPLCTCCGIPFQGVGVDHVCGACIKSPPGFDVARSPFVYDGACREMIHSFKYRNKIHLRRPLALMTIDLLRDFIAAESPDLIVPVPLHRARLRNRGFNQAVLLGEIFSKRCGLTMDRDSLKRLRWTEPQVNLPAVERRTNVKGAFSVADPSRIQGRRVLLLDDVMTTGSTVEECSCVLKKAGAARVSVVTVARAVSQ